MFPLSHYVFRDNAPVCQLFEFCVLFVMPRWLLLELVVTRGRWLQFDNAVQVSLGNRRDLTQDAELPLGFFYAPSPLCLPCIPAFLPSQCPLTEGKDESEVPAEGEMKSWDTTVISVMMWAVNSSHLYIQYCTPGQWKISLIGDFNLSSYHLAMTHFSDISPCVIRLIDCDCGAALKVRHYEVRNGLAACVIILLSNLSDRK